MSPETLFLRKEVTKLGIAPLTSMFFYGGNTNIRPVDNFRPEVHDSDGLQIANATGEWIWRPLINPGRLLVTSFELDNPEGFGPIQRDTDFAHYQDLENDYQMRPSAWVVPGKNWGKGRVELVEIPTNGEKNDNIVAFWVPAAVLKPGNFPGGFFLPDQVGSPGHGRAGPWQGNSHPDLYGRAKRSKNVPDRFRGWKTGRYSCRLKPGGGHFRRRREDRRATYTEEPIYRRLGLVFRVLRTGSDRPLELRAFLRQKDEVLTESWSYVDPFTESGCR